MARLIESNEIIARSRELTPSAPWPAESVIPFAPNTKIVPTNDLDKAGQTMLGDLEDAIALSWDKQQRQLGPIPK
jgi:hypothetical protein